MKNRILLSTAALFIYFKLFAATYPSQYDIVYHRISITVNPGSSGAISNGSVTTYFKTTAASVSQIGFDFRSGMTVSSIKYHGSNITYTYSANKITITFPAAITGLGTLDSVTVNYSGTPAAPASAIPSGYNYDAANDVIYTLGESYSGSSWWPCKDSLVDKIDSVDLIVTTPSAYRAGANGVVTETISGPNRICTWKTKYHIAAYMVNFAAANYTNYQYIINTGGVNMPVMNYFLPGKSTPANRAKVDVIQNVLPVYVSLLNSDYPFKNEKYGIADCLTSLNGNWGALEVQSMTFSATFDDYTLAHELAHQWFGDKLTTNDWHHIWLNEGFAKYFESVIYPENLKGAVVAASQRLSLKNSVSNSLTTYVSDISTVDKIFIGSASEPYEKGAMILSMLRSWLGDTKFFTALSNYLAGPGIAYNFTSVDSLQKYMQAQVAAQGFNLTNFFNDWVYKKGRVTYDVKYQYVTNGVYIQLTQSPTFAGAGYFDMPVPVRIRNGSGLDTTIVIVDRRGTLYNNVTGGTYNANTIYYKLSATPSVAPTLDPQNVVLATVSAISSSSTLNTLIILPFRNIKLAAEPATHSVKLNWTIDTDESLASIVIEKSSNGTDFTEVKKLTPVQTGHELYTGNYTDDLMADVQQYRLKIIKTDGSFVYSSIEKVSAAHLENLQVYPNPVQNKISIFLPTKFNDNNVKVILTNTEGEIVKQFTNNNAGSLMITIPVHNLSAGMYSLTLLNEKGEKLLGRFVKQ